MIPAFFRENLHSILLVAVMSLVTIALRFAPFLIFGSGKKTPELISRLGKVLPFSIMGMLVVFCLKDTSFSTLSAWLPRLIAGAVTVLSYVWKRNTLLSILLGTVLYMVLVQNPIF